MYKAFDLYILGRLLKVDKPDVVVGTPSKLLAQLQSKVSKKLSLVG